MSKYIIKNCENLVYCPSCKTYECGLCLQGDNYRRKCEDNTNCRLKQIVEECVNSLRFSCERILAEKLLGLLNIQEVK